jgi:outer membrane protein
VSRSALAYGVVALLLALPQPARAEPGEPAPLKLSLSEAVERALVRGEEIRLAREQLVRADAQITQVRAGAFPQISGIIRYDRTLRSIFDIDLEGPPGEVPTGDLFGDLPFGRANTWVLGVQVDQTLYAGGRVATGLDIARRVQRATRYGVSEAESEIVRNVRQAYLQVLFTRSLVEIAEQSLEVATEQLELVESFLARGTASEFEVLQARVERDNIEPQLVQARNADRLAELELRRLLNIEVARPLVLDFGPAAVAEVQVSHDEVLRAALRRPAVRAARERVRIQEEAIDLARAGRRPTASAFANFSFQSFPDNLVPAGLPGGEQWREDWVVGLQVTIPIFSGFRVTAEVDEAQSEYRSAVYEERQLRQAITVQAEAALSELEGARAQIVARQATVEQAERALALAELRYENGLARLIELSNARLLLQQARVNEAEARVTYLSALAAVEYATGGQLSLFEET